MNHKKNKSYPLPVNPTHLPRYVLTNRPFFFIFCQQMAKCVFFRTSEPWDVRSYWIGLYSPNSIENCGCDEDCHDDTCAACVECRATYSWSDGSTETFRLWRETLPRTGLDCVRMKPDVGWLVIACSHKLKFICERG